MLEKDRKAAGLAVAEHRWKSFLPGRCHAPRGSTLTKADNLLDQDTISGDTNGGGCPDVAVLGRCLFGKVRDVAKAQVMKQKEEGRLGSIGKEKDTLPNKMCHLVLNRALNYTNRKQHSWTNKLSEPPQNHNVVHTESCCYWSRKIQDHSELKWQISSPQSHCKTLEIENQNISKGGNSPCTPKLQSWRNKHNFQLN